MLNQDIHKNLRRNNNAITLSETAPLSAFNYKRPAGFTLVPSLMGTNVEHCDSPSGSAASSTTASHIGGVAGSGGNRLAAATNSYFDHVQEEMQRYWKPFDYVVTSTTVDELVNEEENGNVDKGNGARRTSISDAWDLPICRKQQIVRRAQQLRLDSTSKISCCS